jgi:membrane protease YdiL (CAAX protease family)
MRAIAAFIATAYALSIALSLLIGFTGGHDSPLIGLGYLSMILPALAVLIVRAALHEGPRICWERFPLRYLPVALFLMPVTMHAVMLPLMAVATGGIQWQPHGNIVLNAVLGVTIVSFLAFFEEVGWRAWLLPRLAERFDARAAVLLTSVIWAIWHVPFQLSGILHIDGITPTRLIVPATFGTLASGLVLGWLWLRTESIWLVSIGHGALNNWGQFAFKYMKDSGSPEVDLSVLAAGSLALFVVGVLLLWRRSA